MTNASHNFWEFSLQVYRAPKVADTCLGLQNGYGLDVNLLLFCCWYGKFYGILPTGLLENAYEHSISWRGNVVQPLRNARSWMKTAPAATPLTSPEFEALRQQIKSIELTAEKMQQQALEKLAAESATESRMGDRIPETGTGTGVDENLKRLLERYGLQASPALESMLEIITRATAEQPAS